MFDFLSNAEVEGEQFETVVPAQFRSFYKAGQEGQPYALDMDNDVVKGAVEAISGLNKALGSERKVTKDLRGKVVDLSPLSEYGDSPQSIAEAITAKLTELEQGSSRINLSKIKEEMTKAHSEQIALKDKTLGELRTRYDTLLLETEARAAATADLVDDPDLIMPFLRDSIKLVEDNGVRRVTIVDSQGDQRFNSATALPMTVRDLLEEMRDQPKYAPLFKSKAPKGAPAPGSGPSRPTNRQGIQPEMTGVQKIAANLPRPQGYAR